MSTDIIPVIPPRPLMLLPRRERRAICRACGYPWQPLAILPDGNVMALPRPPNMPTRTAPMGWPFG